MRARPGLPARARSDRLLHTFRLTAGLPSSATPLGGWEAPDVELRGPQRRALPDRERADVRGNRRPAFKPRGDALVASWPTVQQALRKGLQSGYLSAFPEELIDRVEARKRVWAPYYTLHKIMAGLLDVHQLGGNPQALDVLLSRPHGSSSAWTG